MFCAYHGIDHPETTTFTQEHILPYALGGSDELSISICEQANSNCGSEADAALINNVFITFERVTRDIRGQSGTPPHLTFRGTIEIDGRNNDCTYKVSLLEKKLFVVPSVDRRDIENGGEEITIECEESEFDRIIENINNKLHRNGSEIIDIETCRDVAGRHQIEHPHIQCVTEFDITSFHRAYVKMGLGLAHLVFGESYTRSPDAELLRNFLWEEDREKRAMISINGNIWPTAPPRPGPKLEQVLAFEDWHLLGILNINPLIFLAILFGNYTGFLQLANTVIDDSIPPGDGIIFLINPCTRELYRYRYLEYIAKKQYGTLP